MGARLRRLACIAIVLFALGIVLPISSMPAYAVCRSRVATIVFHIWYGRENGASIMFGGSSFTDGDSTSITWGCGQTYQVRIGFAEDPFRQWASDAGSFSSQTSNPATFYPSGDSGSVAMVRNRNPLTNNWGGYVADIHNLNPGSNYRYSSALQIRITNSTYNSAPNNANDVLLIWAGLGGYNGALWQAGMRIIVSPGGTNSFDEFTDYCTSGSQSSCQTENLNYENFLGGDTVSIIVSYLAGTGASFSIQDLGPSYTWTWSGTFSGYAPDLTTGEIIFEPEWETGYITVCSVPSSGGYCVLPNFGTMTVANNAWAVPGADWSSALLRMDAQGQYPSGTTYANPSYLTSGARFTSGSFSWVYGTSAT